MPNLQSIRWPGAACLVLFKALCAVVLLMSGWGARAAAITYQTTSLGGAEWRYDYTLQGSVPAGGVEGLTIYFDFGLFGPIQNLVAPADWDPLVVRVDTGIPSDGFLDLLSLNGVLQGALIPVSFSIDVQYLGAGAPGAQRYELYVTDPFAVVAAGQTQSAVTVIPEPGSMALVGIALLAAARWRKQVGLRMGRPIPLAD